MSIEAMKQALEALEEACGDRCNAEYNPCHARTAITTLRQAIEQAEKPSEGGDCDSPSWCNQYGKCHRKVVGAPTLANCIEQAEKQEPVAYWNGNGKFATPKAKDWDKRTGGTTAFGIDIPLYTTPQPNVATNDTKQECVAKPQEKRHEWAWMPTPIKTQWGHDMVVADLAIDKDHTVSVYCERDQTARVEAMFRERSA